MNKSKNKKPVVPQSDSDDSSSDDNDVFTKKLHKSNFSSTTPQQIKTTAKLPVKSAAVKYNFDSDSDDSEDEPIPVKSNKNTKLDTKPAKQPTAAAPAVKQPVTDARSKLMSKVAANRAKATVDSSSDDDSSNSDTNNNAKTAQNTKAAQLARLKALRNKQAVASDSDSSSEDDVPVKSTAKSTINSKAPVQTKTVPNKTKPESKRVESSSDDSSEDDTPALQAKSTTLKPTVQPTKTLQPVKPLNKPIVQTQDSSSDDSSDDEPIKPTPKRQPVKPVTQPTKPIVDDSDDDSEPEKPIMSPNTKQLRKPATIIKRNDNEESKTNDTDIPVKSKPNGLTTAFNKLRVGMTSMVKSPFGSDTDDDTESTNKPTLNNSNSRDIDTTQYTFDVANPVTLQQQQSQQRMKQIFNCKKHKSVDAKLSELDASLGNSKPKYGIVGNKLIHSGTVQRQSNSKSLFGGHKLLDRTLYLLNTVLLICEKSGSKVELKTELDLQQCIVDAMYTGDVPQFAVIDKSSKDNTTYIFQCTDIAAKQQWIQQTHKTICQSIYSNNKGSALSTYWYLQYCTNTSHYAVQHSDTNRVNQLLKTNKNIVNEHDIAQNTALHIAIFCNNTEFVALLLQANADQSLVDLHGYNAVQYCALLGYNEILALLLNASNTLKPSSWHNAATGELSDTSAIWLTLLYAQNHYTECLQLLLSKVPDKRLYDNDSKGYNIAEYCLHNNLCDSLTVLYKSQYDINYCNKYNMTLLMQAALIGNITVCNTLIQCGAQPNYVDSSGNTALHYAANIEIASYLVACGARTPLKNNNNIRADNKFDQHSTTLQHCAELYTQRKSCDCSGSTKSQALTQQQNHNHVFDSCAICSTEFTVLYKPTYCRYCSWIVCTDCTTKKCYFPKSDKQGRVCDGCYNVLSYNDTGKSSQRDSIKPQTNIMDTVTSFLTSVKVPVQQSNKPRITTSVAGDIVPSTNDKLSLPVQPTHRKMQSSVSAWSPAPAPATITLTHKSDTDSVNQSNSNMFNLMKSGLNKFAKSTQQTVMLAANVVESNVKKGVNVVNKELHKQLDKHNNNTDMDTSDYMNSDEEREEAEWEERKQYLNPREIAREERQRQKVQAQKQKERDERKAVKQAQRDARDALLAAKQNTERPSKTVEKPSDKASRVSSTMHDNKIKAQQNLRHMKELEDKGDDMESDASDFAAMAAKLKQRSKPKK